MIDRWLSGLAPSLRSVSLFNFVCMCLEYNRHKEKLLKPKIHKNEFLEKTPLVTTVEVEEYGLWFHGCKLCPF